MGFDGRKSSDGRDDRKSESRDMPRLPGDGVDRGVGDDGTVHDMVYVQRSYAFRCRCSVTVYNAYYHGVDVCEEVTFFTFKQARALETDQPVTCFECLSQM